MKRVKYVDLVRTLGIILMIMGHVGFGKTFDYWIHAFHMPIFFIISGYFFMFKNLKIGKNSIVYLCMNQLVITCIVKGERF